MHCTWCGSRSVRVHGSQWSCGWCGSFGTVSTPPKPKPKLLPVTLTFSFSYQVELPEAWSNIQQAFIRLAPEQPSLARLLSKILVYHISVGVQHAAALPEEKTEELRTFLQNTTNLNLDETADEILCNIRRGILFREEAALSEEDCGTFWAELFSARPVDEYYNRVEPEGLYELLSELACVYAYFGGEEGEEMGEAQAYRNALQEAYNIHWQNTVLLHPDIERAKRLLAAGKLPDGEDICREILLVEYPEEVPHENAEDFDEQPWDRILHNVFSTDTATGIDMWRRLLDIAEPCLKTSQKAAEELLPDWKWLEAPELSQALPLLNALEDAHFVSQLFQSASIGRLQYNILKVCQNHGREAMGQRCLLLGLENPCLEEGWKKRFKRTFPATLYDTKAKAQSGQAPSAAEPDGSTVYHYCSVQIQKAGRPYAYLTGGLPLKVGDWVELPFGKDDALRRGQVTAVMDCTRAAAPWPPEQTKAILRITDAPQIEPMAKATAPWPAEQPKATAEKDEKPVTPVKEAAECPKADTQTDDEPAVSAQGKERPVKPKKPFPFARLLAAVLAVAVVAGISVTVSRHNRQKAAAYAIALQTLSDGDYTSAEQDFSALSGYRDSAPLSVYCKYANIYRDATDYVGGDYELANLHLQYNTDWQPDIDALASRVNGYKAEKDAAEEAERQQRLRDKYSGKLPVDGMPVSCLQYTSLGLPTKTDKCPYYKDMDIHRRYKIHHWYTSDGKTVASCQSKLPKDETEEVIYSFTYYDPPLGSVTPRTLPSTYRHNNSSNSGYSIRDDYDNPEDLWEDNRDWYDDEDEAWDEWYND